MMVMVLVGGGGGDASDVVLCTEMILVLAVAVADVVLVR